MLPGHFNNTGVEVSPKQHLGKTCELMPYVPQHDVSASKETINLNPLDRLTVDLNSIQGDSFGLTGTGAGSAVRSKNTAKARRKPRGAGPVSGHRRFMPDGQATGFAANFATKPAAGSALVVGQIESVVGACTLTRPDGDPFQIKIGDPICGGDIIETAAGGKISVRFIDGTAFNLSDSARVVVKEFGGDSARPSALFDISRGTFAFIAGEMAKLGGLRIETPFASLRGRAQSGGIGMLSLASLFFAALESAQAGPTPAGIEVGGTEDGQINFRESSDIQNAPYGIIELTIGGRTIFIDNPFTEYVVRGTSVSQLPLTPAQLLQHQVESNNVQSIAALGQGPTVGGPSGSGGLPPPEPPPFVTPINIFVPSNPGGPIGPTGGGGGPGGNGPNSFIPPQIFDNAPPPPPGHPTAQPNGTPGASILDESPLPLTGDGIHVATANLANNFSPPDFGPDGPGGTVFSLVLTGSDVPSGLFALGVSGGKGTEIALNQSGNTITGSADGKTYFTISIDPTTGEVTFASAADTSIWHPIPNNSNDTATLTLASADLLQVVQTVTDSTGDAASASVDLGTGVFEIRDDGPTAHIALVSEAGVSVDETVPSGDEGPDPFAAYGTPLGTATATLVSTAGSESGQDNFGATTHITLSIVGGDGADSGLTTTNGTPIHLFLNGGIVEGRVEGSDAVAFAVLVDDAGQVTVAQYLSLHHPDSGNPDETIGLAGKIDAVVTVTDGDGDVATDTVDVGAVISFHDDGPTATFDTNNVNEGALLTVNAASGVLTNDVPGADGFAAGGGVVGVRKASGDLTSAVTTGAGTDIAGDHGTLHLNADGSYTYQATANDISSNTTDVFVYTIKDGDGDLSTTTLTINLADSALHASDDDEVTVYEKALDTSITGSDIAAGTVTGSLPGSPLETDASNTLTDNVTGGFGTKTYALVGSATGLYGTIQINSNGSYVYTLTKPFDTSPDADNGANTEQNRDSFTYQVTDSNGNTSTATIFVDIVDDTPTATFDTNNVNEGALLTVNAALGVLTNDVPGADGFAAGGGVVGVRKASGD
ncbi:MAG TPA: DUF5801 repeats-in-toxin domain-containing protein, partial [Pseudolabrys sp.]|nr:DUF5801 repeats-in-toxin domain-containing protein [Pseudolabrys sp.]